MINGQIILREEKPYHLVRIIASPAPGYVPGSGSDLYELAPVVGGGWTYVRDPAPGEITLAPGCEVCGKAPGFTTCHYDGTHDDQHT